MPACELVELAAVVAVEGPRLIERGGTISAKGIERYWVASRCRLDRWASVLGELPTSNTPGNAARARARQSLWHAVVEEVLTGEILVRVVAAVGSGYDRRRGGNEVEPLARSIYSAHLEARNRVLRFLVRGEAIDAAEALRLDRLRRRVERWSDMLVGYVADADQARQYAVDVGRAAEFAEDLHHRRGGARRAWPLVRAALVAAFRRRIAATSPNADLNAQIAAGVLACFPTARMGPSSQPQSLWQARLAGGAERAEDMLASLLEPTESIPSPSDRQAADAMLLRLRRFGRC